MAEIAIVAVAVPGSLPAALIAAGVLIAIVGYLAGARQIVIGGWSCSSPRAR
jgi:hypothetical protein